jgi:hypothetical protein
MKGLSPVGSPDGKNIMKTITDTGQIGMGRVKEQCRSRTELCPGKMDGR